MRYDLSFRCKLKCFPIQMSENTAIERLHDLCRSILRPPTEEYPGIIFEFNKKVTDAELREFSELLFYYHFDFYVGFVQRNTRSTSEFAAKARERALNFISYQLQLGHSIHIVTNADLYSAAFCIRGFATKIKQFQKANYSEDAVKEIIFKLVQVALTSLKPSAPSEEEVNSPNINEEILGNLDIASFALINNENSENLKSPDRILSPDNNDVSSESVSEYRKLRPEIIAELHETFEKRKLRHSNCGLSLNAEAQPDSQTQHREHIYEVGDDHIALPPQRLLNPSSTAMARHVLYNPERYLEALEKFNNEGNREIENFFTSFEEACQEANIQGDDRVRKLRICLRGAPNVTLEDILARNNNDLPYEDAKNQLITKYSKRQSAASHVREMGNRVFLPHAETFENYFDDKMRLIDRALPGCENARRVALIVEGLPSPYKFMAKNANYATPELLFAACKDMCRDDMGINAIVLHLQRLEAKMEELKLPHQTAEVNAVQNDQRNNNRGNGSFNRPNRNNYQPQPRGNFGTQPRGSSGNPARGNFANQPRGNYGNQFRGNFGNQRGNGNFRANNNRGRNNFQAPRNFNQPRGNLPRNFNQNNATPSAAQSWPNSQVSQPNFQQFQAPPQNQPLTFTQNGPMQQRPCVVCLSPQHDLRQCPTLRLSFAQEKNLHMGQPM